MMSVTRCGEADHHRVGSALLTVGNYFLQLTGTGGGTSGYGGNLTTAGVNVVPIPGVALAVPFGVFGMGWLARRRKKLVGQAESPVALA